MQGLRGNSNRPPAPGSEGILLLVWKHVKFSQPFSLSTFMILGMDNPKTQRKRLESEWQECQESKQHVSLIPSQYLEACKLYIQEKRGEADGEGGEGGEQWRTRFPERRKCLERNYHLVPQAVFCVTVTNFQFTSVWRMGRSLCSLPLCFPACLLCVL